MNRYERVLLLIPGYPESHYFSRPLQAGLGYISESLKRADIENVVVDMRFNPGQRHLLKEVRRFRPDLIGVSMMTFKYLYTYELLDVLKNECPRIDIVAGGPHPSTLRNDVLRECRSIDYGAVLEGEATIIELCRGLPLDEIKGLIYRKDGEIVFSGEREFVKNLDGIPFPRYNNLNLNRYENFIPIISSRGCPYKCIYCPVSLAIGKKYRFRSPENIVAEIKYWYGKGYRRFGFADDNFTLIPKRVFRLCRLIEEENLTGLKLSCSNGIRADRVDYVLLKRMRDVGFSEIAFGVEAGNNRVLRNLKKSESIESIRESIDKACELGYEVTLFFLLGSPGETFDDIQDSIALAKSFPVVNAVFYNLIPFPNTELSRWVDENGLFARDKSSYLNDASHFLNEPIFETPELPLERRKEALATANAAVKEHCRKNKESSVRKKLERSFGINGIPGYYLARLWCADPVQNRLLTLRVMRRLKEKLTA